MAHTTRIYPALLLLDKVVFKSPRLKGAEFGGRPISCNCILSPWKQVYRQDVAVHFLRLAFLIFVFSRIEGFDMRGFVLLQLKVYVSGFVCGAIKNVLFLLKAC